MIELFGAQSCYELEQSTFTKISTYIRPLSGQIINLNVSNCFFLIQSSFFINYINTRIFNDLFY